MPSRSLRGSSSPSSYKHRGEIDIGRLCEEVHAVTGRFRGELQAGREGHDALRGFGLVERRETCAVILQRTVFISTGPDTVRFIHWSWQELELYRECQVVHEELDVRAD